MTTMPPPVTAWHRIAGSRDASLLPELLADDIVFRSPAVHTPQAGRARATAYLSAALVVLGPSLRYRREWYGEDSAVLEFEAELDGLSVHGVDMLQWNADGRLVDFTVMVRPMRGLQQLITHMGQQLAAQS
jgi:SnoaL-like domain